MGYLTDIAGKLRNYFNPTSNNGNNFWSTPVAQGMGNVQNTIQQAPRNIVQPIIKQLTTPIMQQPLINNPLPFKLPFKSPTIGQGYQFMTGDKTPIESVQNFAKGFTSNPSETSPYKLGQAPFSYTAGQGIAMTPMLNEVVPEGKATFNLYRGAATGLTTAGAFALANKAAGKPVNPSDSILPFALGTIMGALHIPEEDVNGAVKLLQNKLTKSDVNNIGRFSEIIDLHGPQVDLGKIGEGELGKTMASLVKNVFGKDAETWSNTKIKNVFDVVLGKIGQNDNQAGLGLSINDIRNGTKAPDAQPTTGGVITNAEGKVKLQAKPMTPVEQAVDAQLKPSKFANVTAPQSPSVGKALATSLKDRNVLYTTQTEQAGIDIASEYANGNLTQKSTDVLNTLSKEKGTITRQEALNAQAVALKLQDQLGNVAVENMTPAQKSALETSTNILSQLSEHYTAGGQLSQSAAVLKNQTAQGLYYQAIKTLSGVKDAKGVSLLDKNPELATTISNLTNDVKGTAVGTPEREMAVQRLVKAVTDQVPRSKGDAAFGIWRSMLISGPETAVKVMSSYGINTPGQLLSRPISALTDRIVSALRGSDRSITFNPSDYGTFGKGMAGGAEAIPTKMKTGLDLPGTSSFNSYDNPAQAMTHSSQQTGFEKVVTRLHASIPKPVYKATYDMNIAEQARTAAVNAGKSGDKTFIQGLIDHPTSQMQDIAKVEAEKATNMASNAATRASSAVQNMPYIGKILNPIARVPANIGVQGLVDYSPLGLVKAGGEVVKGIFKGNFDQRAFSTAVGKGVVGTGIVATGFALMQAGRMALAQPNDAKERALNEAQNIPSNSVYIGGNVTKDANGIFHRSGGTWLSLNVAGAAGLTLAMGGGLAKGGPTTALTSGARELADQPYIQGVAGFGQALSDPTRYASTFFDKTATSIVPGLVAQPATGMDTNQRVYPTNIGDALKAKIPILRQTLPVARNMYGQPLPGANPSGTVLGGIAGSFNPFYPHQATNQNDPVTTELQRLYNQNGSQGSPSIAQPAVNQTIDKQKVKLNSQQLMNYVAMRGPQIQQAIGNLIADPNYQKLSDDQKTNAINKLITRIDTSVKGFNGSQIMSNNPATNALLASNNQLAMSGYQSSGAPNMNGQVGISSINTKMTYVDSKGVLQTVDTTMPTKPQLTGNTFLDQKLVSDYKSALTARANDIYELYKAGQITEEQATTELTKLTNQKIASAKKPKKITIKMAKAPKITNVKASKPKKPATFKVKKTPTFKVTKAKKIAQFKVKGIKRSG